MKHNPPIETLISFLDRKSITLIGNASSIFKKDHTKNINSHDVVWRINHGVKLSHSQKLKISNRCDVYSCGGPNGNVDKTEFTTTHPNHYIYSPAGDNAIESRLPNNYSLLPFKYTNTLIEKIREYGGEDTQVPSTGLITLFFLSEDVKYEKITLFGFDFFNTQTWYRNMKHFGGHNPCIEKTLFEEILNNKNILMA